MNIFFSTVTRLLFSFKKQVQLKSQPNSNMALVSPAYIGSGPGWCRGSSKCCIHELWNDKSCVCSHLKFQRGQIKFLRRAFCDVDYVHTCLHSGPSGVSTKARTSVEPYINDHLSRTK